MSEKSWDAGGKLIAAEERALRIEKKIDEAWDDPRPSLPADEVFDEIVRRLAEGE